MQISKISKDSPSWKRAMQFDPLKDGISRIELIDSMGNDLSVVNDARASFDKSSDSLTDKDIKLLQYLIKHKHTSPLRGVTFKFKVKAPLFICRQWWKHCLASNHNDEQIGWNERSFRYTDAIDQPEFYQPKTFAKQSTSNKQASAGILSENENTLASALYKATCDSSYDTYYRLINLGVSREQARAVLVPAIYTSWVWTVSLQSVLNFIDLRTGNGAQSEIALYAGCVEKLITPIVPETLKAWHIDPVLRSN